LTHGRAATPEPFDLGAVAGSDELFEALSTRRLADLGTGGADAEDPAAALLAALVADVDAGAPPLPAPTRMTCGMPSARRGGVRVVVAFGVAALVLTSAGAAAAGGGGADAMRTTHGPARTRGTERSNANAQWEAPAVQTRVTIRRGGTRRTGGARDLPAQPRSDASRPQENRPLERHAPRQVRSGPQTETGRPTPTPAPPTWGQADPTPTPDPGDGSTMP
jgi:hypothetical protein